MLNKIGNKVIYKGEHLPELVKGQSYIIDYIIISMSMKHYYYLNGYRFQIFDSDYFVTIKDYRKLKLQKLNEDR